MTKNIFNLKIVPKNETSFEEDEPTLDSDMLLNTAIGELKHALIIGQTLDDEFYISSTTGDKKTLLYWIEDFKMRLLNGAYDE
jgi:hypothetical protein